MERKHSEIRLLLGVLLLFSAGLGWFFSAEIGRSQGEASTNIKAMADAQDSKVTDEEPEDDGKGIVKKGDDSEGESKLEKKVESEQERDDRVIKKDDDSESKPIDSDVKSSEQQKEPAEDEKVITEEEPEDDGKGIVKKDDKPEDLEQAPTEDKSMADTQDQSGIKANGSDENISAPKEESAEVEPDDDGKGIVKKGDELEGNKAIGKDGEPGQGAAVVVENEAAGEPEEVVSEETPAEKVSEKTTVVEMPVLDEKTIVPSIPEGPKPVVSKPSNPSQSESQVDIPKGGLVGVSLEEAFRKLMPYRVSHSVEKIASLMRDMPKQELYALADKLMKDANQLNRLDKLQLLFSLVDLYRTDQSTQEQLLGLISRYNFLREGAPILFVAAKNAYAHVIPAIFIWEAKLKANVGKEAIAYAISQNDQEVLAVMLERGVALNATAATELLWSVLSENKDARMIAPLVDEQADVNSVKNGYTLLIQAVKNENLDQVKALIAAKADVNLLADPSIGTALQMAIEKAVPEIENLLRDNGAKD